MKCNEFVGTLFLARDVAHSTHLNTRSYAKHTALNAFYDGIVDLADNFAETYQGKYGMIGPVSLMTAKPFKNVLDFLEGQVKEIEANRFVIVDKDCTPLQNIIDEILGLYYRTIYKIKFLT